MKRLMYGAATAVALAGVLGWLWPSGAINCDIFWYTLECWFAS